MGFGMFNSSTNGTGNIFFRVRRNYYFYYNSRNRRYAEGGLLEDRASIFIARLLL